MMANTISILIWTIGFPTRAQDPRDSVPRSPVAVVSAVSGDVAVTEPGRVRRTISRFDWLQEGSLLEVGAGSWVNLAFATGSCYEMGAAASARLMRGGFTETSGKIISLPSVPPLPQIQIAPPIKADRGMAVRIRGTRVSGLYPAAGAAVLPDEAVLRYARVPGAETYRVEVEGQDGASVFRVETRSTTISVPSGVLEQETHYQWSVRTVGASGGLSGSGARGEAAFSTLSLDNLRSRARLREVLAGSDGRSLALLAEVDRSLGLRWEAREGFRQALAKDPDDAGLRAALAAVEDLVARDAAHE